MIDSPLLLNSLYDNGTYHKVPITDSHCHLSLIHHQDPNVFEHIYLTSQQENLMILDIGLSPRDFESRKKITQHITQVYYAVGMHPCKSLSYTPQALADDIEPRIAQASAVGEIGLDWYRMYSDKKHQMELFRLQVEMAYVHKKPIIIHSRESLDDIIAVMRETSSHIENDGLGIMHCFSGNKAQAKHCLDLGFYISFAGNTSYASASNIREVASYIPITRLLVETDSPYLLHKDIQKIIAKNKKRYTRTNSPAYLLPLMNTLATLRNTTLEDIAYHTRINLQKLLKLS